MNFKQALSLIPSKNTFYVLTQNVKFQIDYVARLQCPEAGMVVGVGDNGDPKTVTAGVKYGEANAVDADGAFFHCDVAYRSIVLKIKQPASIQFLYTCTYRSLIHMALHNVTVKPAVGGHASFKVDFAAGAEVTQVGLFQRFLYGGHCIRIPLDTGDGKAHSIVAKALIDFKFMTDRGRQPESEIGTFGRDFLHLSQGFDYSCKHRCGQNFLQK